MDTISINITVMYHTHLWVQGCWSYGTIGRRTPNISWVSASRNLQSVRAEVIEGWDSMQKDYNSRPAMY